MNNKGSGLGKILGTWGSIIVLAASILMGWATLQANVQNLAGRVTSVETAQASEVDARTREDTELAQIQTDIQWIKADLQGKISPALNTTTNP